MLAGCTWSHSIDNESSPNLGSNNNSGARFFRLHPEWGKGNSGFDIRNRFTLGYVWDLPFSNGKAVAGDASGALNTTIAGNKVPSADQKDSLDQTISDSVKQQLIW